MAKSEADAGPIVLPHLTFQSHLTTWDLGLECFSLVPVWTIFKFQGGQQPHDVRDMRPLRLLCDCRIHRAQSQLAKRPQEGDPVLCAKGGWERGERQDMSRAGLHGKHEQEGTYLRDVRAAQTSPMGEKEASQAQA